MNLLEQFGDDSRTIATLTAEIAELRTVVAQQAQQIAHLQSKHCPYLRGIGATRWCALAETTTATETERD